MLIEGVRLKVRYVCWSGDKGERTRLLENYTDRSVSKCVKGVGRDIFLSHSWNQKNSSACHFQTSAALVVSEERDWQFEFVTALWSPMWGNIGLSKNRSTQWIIKRTWHAVPRRETPFEKPLTAWGIVTTKVHTTEILFRNELGLRVDYNRELQKSGAACQWIAVSGVLCQRRTAWQAGSRARKRAMPYI